MTPYEPVLPGFYPSESLPFTGKSRDTVETSKEAADHAAPSASIQRERIYQALVNCWPEGLTDDELQRKLGLDGNTQRPRRRELEQAGRIQAKGTRQTASGRSAVVWVLA